MLFKMNVKHNNNPNRMLYRRRVLINIQKKTTYANEIMQYANKTQNNIFSK